MSSSYIASNWRLPNEENSNKSDNYGLSFNGSNSIINFGNITELQGATKASFSMWLNVNSTGIEGLFNQWGTGTDRLIYSFIWIAQGRIDIYINDGARFRVTGNSIISSLSTDEWFNLTIVYDGTQSTSTDRVKAYINNQELTGNIFGGPTSLYSSTTDFILGTYPSGTYFDGKMSEFSIFDYALSSTQVSTLYGSSSLGAGNPMAIKRQPVGYWPLGDNSSGNPLTQPNEAVEDASVFDFSLTNNNSINIGNNTLLAPTTNPFTFSAWIKPNNWSATYSVIYATPTTNGIWIGKESSNGFVLRASNDANYLTHTLPTAGEWTHILITRDASNTTTLYYNGVSQTTATVTKDFVQGTTYIGSDNANNEFNGEISNVAYWNSDQSSEISNIYNSGVPATSYTNTPTAWYKLDQSANWDVSGSGNWTIPDASGNGNDGTSSGMTSANLVLSDLTRAVPYENYSLSFDSGSSDTINCGNVTALNGLTSASFSMWLKLNSTGIEGLFNQWGSGSDRLIYGFIWLGGGRIDIYMSGNLAFRVSSNAVINALSTGQWFNLIITYDGTEATSTDRVKAYIDNQELTGNIGAGPTSLFSSTTDFILGTYPSGSYLGGQMNHFSIFDQTLTSTEILKLYANGLPQDLTNFTPQPTHWWTLGKESFWNGSDFIVRDMIGSNDGTSANMGVDSLTADAPRSSANGTGTNMDIPTNLEGSTKWSSNNSWSINMSSEARVTDVP